MGKGAEDVNATPKASIVDSMKEQMTTSFAKMVDFQSTMFGKCAAKREKGPKVEDISPAPPPAKCFGC